MDNTKASFTFPAEITQVACTATHCLALCTDGNAYIVPVSPDEEAPTLLMRNVISIAGSSTFCAVVTDDGGVFVMGHCPPYLEHAEEMTRLKEFDGGRVSAVYCGEAFILALSDGPVRCRELFRPSPPKHKVFMNVLGHARAHRFPGRRAVSPGGPLPIAVASIERVVRHAHVEPAGTNGLLMSFDRWVDVEEFFTSHGHPTLDMSLGAATFTSRDGTLLSALGAPAHAHVRVTIVRACVLCNESDGTSWVPWMDLSEEARAPFLPRDLTTRGHGMMSSLLVCESCAIAAATRYGFKTEEECCHQARVSVASLLVEYHTSGRRHTDPAFLPHAALPRRGASPFRVADPEHIRYPSCWRRVGDFGEAVPNPRIDLHAMSPRDIEQGQVGTGYLLGSLVVIGQRKELLAQIFIELDLEVGVCAMRFARDGKWLPVLVDDWLPCGGAEPLCSWSRDPNNLTVMLIEKGYAHFSGGYEAVYGGTERGAMVSLTGGLCEVLDFKDPKIARRLETGVMVDELTRALTAGHLLSCYVSHDHAIAGPSTAVECSINLVPRHAYAIVDTAVVAGRSTIRLQHTRGSSRAAWSRTPSGTARGKETAHNDEDDDGVFCLSYPEFVASFSVIEMITSDAARFPHGVASVPVDARALPVFSLSVREPGTTVALELVQAVASRAFYGEEIALDVCTWQRGMHYYTTDENTSLEKVYLKPDWRTSTSVGRVYPSKDVKISLAVTLSPASEEFGFFVAPSARGKVPTPCTLHVRADKPGVRLLSTHAIDDDEEEVVGEDTAIDVEALQAEHEEEMEKQRVEYEAKLAAVADELEALRTLNGRLQAGSMGRLSEPPGGQWPLAPRVDNSPPPLPPIHQRRGPEGEDEEEDAPPAYSMIDVDDVSPLLPGPSPP